jgi:hypothetical protein
VDGIGNGDAMAIEALHSGLDVVEVLRAPPSKPGSHEE